MTAFNRRSVWFYVRRNQITFDLDHIHKGKKVKPFQFLFFIFLGGFCLIYIGKDLLEINFIFSL